MIVHGWLGGIGDIKYLRLQYSDADAVTAVTSSFLSLSLSLCSGCINILAVHITLHYHIFPQHPFRILRLVSIYLWLAVL